MYDSNEVHRVHIDSNDTSFINHNLVVGTGSDTLAGPYTLEVHGDIGVHGGTAGIYRGLRQENHQSLVLGDTAGTEPRIYLHGSANGDADHAGNVYLSAANATSQLYLHQNGMIQMGGDAEDTPLIDSYGLHITKATPTNINVGADLDEAYLVIGDASHTANMHFDTNEITVSGASNMHLNLCLLYTSDAADE